MSTSTERMRRLRERRAASAGPDPDAPARDADELLAPAVEETIQALQLGEADAGAVLLLRRYAAVIDRARDPAYALRWLGPLMLDALQSLEATPASRAKTAPKPSPQTRTRLDELRAARRNRPGA